MTDTQLLHKANGIRRIRECCQRAWIELNSNMVTVKVADFTIQVDDTLKDDEFYFRLDTLVNIVNPPTQTY